MKDHFSEVRMMHWGSRGPSHEHSLKASALLHTKIMTFFDTMIKNVCPGLTLECNLYKNVLFDCVQLLNLTLN